MAVTLTVETAMVAARIITSTTNIPEPVLAAAQVLHASASEQIARYAPEAPSSVQNDALVRMLAYLWQLPQETRYRGHQSALRNSGAIGSLAPYRAKRAGIIGGESLPQSPTTPSTPAGTGGPGVDQTARDAAKAAQAAAAAAQAVADEALSGSRANTGFLSTFTGRVRSLVEGIVPAWARMATPPTVTPTPVPVASESVSGTVTLARAEDVADTETDLTRVPVVSRVISLVRRLIGENVRSIPEATSSHIGRPLVATRDSSPWVSYEKLSKDAYSDNSIFEGHLNASVRAKINASHVDETARNSATQALSVASGAGTQARAAKTAADSAQEAADAAQLATDTVIEIGPPLVRGETAARNLNISLRHPINAYPDANQWFMRIAGQVLARLEYTPNTLQQDVDAELSAVVLGNIWDQTTNIDDGQGGTTQVPAYPAGSYVPVEVRLDGPPASGVNRVTHFIRVVDVLVVDEYEPPDGSIEESKLASGVRTKLNSSGAGVPAAPANTNAAKKYELSVPANSGAATWTEATGGGGSPSAGGGIGDSVELVETGDIYDADGTVTAAADLTKFRYVADGATTGDRVVIPAAAKWITVKSAVLVNERRPHLARNGGNLYCMFEVSQLPVVAYDTSATFNGLPFAYNRGANVEPDTYFVHFAKTSSNELLAAFDSEGGGTPRYPTSQRFHVRYLT